MTAISLECSTEPIFFKELDFQEASASTTDSSPKSKLTTYEVCEAVSRMIGPGKIDGAQAPDPAIKGGVWRLYLRSKQARTELLLRADLRLKDITVPLYDLNPNATGQSSIEDLKEKITIKYLPISVSNDELQKFLDNKGVTLTTDIKYAKARDKNGKLTEYKTGDRYCFANAPIKPLLPRAAKVAGIRCKIYHDGQFQTECKSCGKQGHKAGSQDCPAYSDGENITTFKGHKCVLSNFYKCRLNAFGKTFDGGLEFAFQWRKAMDCGRLDLAEQILQASHAGEAKKLAGTLPPEMADAWENKAQKTMAHLVKLKANQCPEFRQALMESTEYIAEGTNNLKWGSGLNPDLTSVTKPSFWPGKNLLGEIMMDLRDQLKDGSYTKDEDSELSLWTTDTNTTLDVNPTEDKPQGPSHQKCDTQSSQNEQPKQTPTRGRPKKRPGALRGSRCESLPGKDRMSAPKDLGEFLANFRRSRTPKRKPSGEPCGHQPSPRPKLDKETPDT